MSYIEEINAFHLWLIENSLPANAQALWHRLMAYCNAFSWRTEFTLTNTRLSEELEINRQALDRARNTLCQKGLIAYKKGSGQQSGTYQIIPFVSEMKQCFVTQHGHNTGTTRAQGVVQTEPETEPETETLYKRKPKTKTNRKDNTDVLSKKSSQFIPPTLEEIKAYCRERNNSVDPQVFFDYFDTSGWIDGNGNPVRNWKQKMITWEGRQHSTNKPSATSSGVFAKFIELEDEDE